MNTTTATRPACTQYTNQTGSTVRIKTNTGQEMRVPNGATVTAAARYHFTKTKYPLTGYDSLPEGIQASANEEKMETAINEMDEAADHITDALSNLETAMQ